MNEAIDYAKLADEIIKRMPPTGDDDLWCVADIALYMRKSKDYVYRYITNDHTFPRGLKIAGGNKVWYVKDVKQWCKNSAGITRNAC